MAVVVKPDGRFEVLYNGPWTGINTLMPENLIADTDTPASNDFIFRNAEIRSRPSFIGAVASPVPSGVINAVGSLGNDVTKSFFSITNDSLYTFNFNTTTWTKQSGSSPVSISQWRIFNNVLYMVCNNAHLSSWDGTTFTQDIATVAGNTVGAVFINELDNHLLMANTVEQPVSVFPNRMRWSATSLPTVWDAAVNPNAGSNDFLDVADSITGMLMLGRVGYILRTDGITEIAPTGQGAAPFQFNHLWANQIGLGNTKFYGEAAYGNTGVVLSRDNVYSLSSYNIQPIGGGARDVIMNDLATAGGIHGALSNIWGVIVPYFRSGIVTDISAFSNANAGPPTFCYLLYMLYVNVGNDCHVWACNLENNNSWEKYIFTNISVTGQPSLCIDSTGAPTLIVPIFNNNTLQSSFVRFDTGTFNDATQGSSHSFRQEDILPGRTAVVQRVLLHYRDLGTFTITATVTGVDDNGNAVTATQTQQIVGTGNNAIKTVIMYPTQQGDRPFTGFRPQLTISRAANGGPVSIVMAQMIGRCSEMELA